MILVNPFSSFPAATGGSNVFSDDFSGANNFVDIQGVTAIVSQRIAAGSANSDVWAYYNTAVGNQNMTIEADMICGVDFGNGGVYSGIVACVDTLTKTGIAWRTNGGAGMELLAVNNGSESGINGSWYDGGTLLYPGASVHLKLTTSWAGSVCTVTGYVNGVQRLQGTTSVGLGKTRAGICFYSSPTQTSQTFDNYTAATP